MSPSEDFRHLRPEDMQKFIPGVFRYERDSAIAERAIEAHRFYLRTKVEALRDEAMDNNWPDAIVAYQTVLDLLKEPE